MLERLEWDEADGEVVYRARPGRHDACGESVARWHVLEFLARVLDHLPEPGQQLLRYWGWYSNSATAALHLVVEALGLKAGQGVLVPTHTFAATAEVVRYLGAIPILVDSEPATLNMDLDDAERKLAELRRGELTATISPDLEVVGIIPVHVGGLMMDVEAVRAFAARHGLAKGSPPTTWGLLPGAPALTGTGLSPVGHTQPAEPSPNLRDSSASRRTMFAMIAGHAFDTQLCAFVES